MRRLSAARDRELRHVVQQQVAWRANWAGGGWYPWCRVCSRNAENQVSWLIDNGYVVPELSSVANTVNVQPTDLVGPYLERYPR